MIKKYLNFFKYYLKNKKNSTIIKSVNLGKNIVLENNCMISKRIILGDNVSIGKYTYLNSSKYWTTIESNTTIGRFCSIAPNVHIGAGNHDYSLVSTHPFLFDRYYEEKKIIEKNSQMRNGLKDKNSTTIIGNDVWIGYGCIIKRGIKIGDGAVVAAGSVVVKDVPDYAIVGGNPAKIIKYRTTEKNIIEMKKNNKNMWWNWNVKDISKNIDIMYDFDLYLNHKK